MLGFLLPWSCVGLGMHSESLGALVCDFAVMSTKNLLLQMSATPDSDSLFTPSSMVSGVSLVGSDIDVPFSTGHPPAHSLPAEET